MSEAEDTREPGDNTDTAKQEPELPSFLANPKRIDIILFVVLILMAVYSLCMIPLRAWLLTQPLAYTLLVGGYTSAVVAGANASVDTGTWWIYLLCTVIGAVKFMPVYWLMGRHWGREFIDMSLQYMPRAHKIFTRALDRESTSLYAWVIALIPLGFAPGPVPNTVVNAVAGLIRIRFPVMLLVNVLSVLLVNGIFMWLGFTFGEQVLDIVNVINRYLLWITLGLIAVMVFRARRQISRS